MKQCWFSGSVLKISASTITRIDRKFIYSQSFIDIYLSFSVYVLRKVGILYGVVILGGLVSDAMTYLPTRYR